MRKKKDILIKMHNLVNTMYLTNEEFGIIVRLSMLFDDANEDRYECVNERTIEKAKIIEEQWMKEFEVMIERKPELDTYLNMICSQAKKSRKAFYDLQRNMDNKKYELRLSDEMIDIKYSQDNKKNIPSQKELDGILKNYADEKTTKKAIEKANKEKWKKTLEEYIDEVLANENE